MIVDIVQLQPKQTSTKTLSMDVHIAVGFGEARLTLDGETVWDESAYMRLKNGNVGYHDMMSVAEAEKLATLFPGDHDWRIILNGPLSGETYQRQGVKKWVCIEENEGFA